jgi:hypothetical protein
MSVAVVQRRRYVAPGADTRPRLGDIVRYDGASWDVVGTSVVHPPDGAGRQPIRLQLERYEEGARRRRRLVRAHPLADEVQLLGRQVLMAGTVELARAPDPGRKRVEEGT